VVAVSLKNYLKEKGLEGSDARVQAAAEQGKTVVFLLVNGRVEGALALADVIRDESRNALRRLRERGIQLMMLTGDTPTKRQLASRK
jgi:Cu2+-exporting ATPase